MSEEKRNPKLKDFTLKELSGEVLSKCVTGFFVSEQGLIFKNGANLLKLSGLAIKASGGMEEEIIDEGQGLGTNPKLKEFSLKELASEVLARCNDGFFICEKGMILKKGSNPLTVSGLAMKANFECMLQLKMFETKEAAKGLVIPGRGRQPGFPFKM